MKKFSIKNQEEKNECLMWISDLYKDVYGSRPRGYNFHKWSFSELSEFVNDLNVEADRDRREAEEYVNDCVNKFKHDLNKLEKDQNINYKTALKWMFEGYVAEDGFDYLSVEGFTMFKGIDYTDLGRKVELDLIEIVNENLEKFDFNWSEEKPLDKEEVLDHQFDPLFN